MRPAAPRRLAGRRGHRPHPRPPGALALPGQPTGKITLRCFSDTNDPSVLALAARGTTLRKPKKPTNNILSELVAQMYCYLCIAGYYERNTTQTAKFQ